MTLEGVQTGLLQIYPTWMVIGIPTPAKTWMQHLPKDQDATPAKTWMQHQLKYGCNAS